MKKILLLILPFLFISCEDDSNEFNAENVLRTKWMRNDRKEILHFKTENIITLIGESRIYEANYYFNEEVVYAQSAGYEESDSLTYILLELRKKDDALYGIKEISRCAKDGECKKKRDDVIYLKNY